MKTLSVARIKQTLAGRLLPFVIHNVPVKSLSMITGRQEPSSVAPQMDAGRILSILSAAESGSTRDLFALYRDVMLADSHIQVEFTKRVLAVIGDSFSTKPADKQNQADIDTAASVQATITGCPGWRKACCHLLLGSIYPVSIVEKQFRATPSGYQLVGLHPLNHQLLDYTQGELRIYDVDPVSHIIMGTSSPLDPARYIVHRGHILTAPDNWGGPMRSILFWWLLSAMDREWWARFLERYGSPFMVGKYSDNDGRTVLERALSLSTKLGGLVISEETSVEIKEAAKSDTGQAYSAFLELCQREKSKAILGQTLSATADSTGLGSGVANMQEGVRQDIRKFDATMLGETLRDQLIVQICRINNLPGGTPSLMWGAESVSEIASTMNVLSSLNTANLEPTDDAVSIISERVGFGVQRRAGGSSFGPTPFSAGGDLRVAARRRSDEIDSIARAGSAPLARAMRERSAEAARIIMQSSSADSAMEALTARFSDLAPEQVSSLIADTLTASAYNGLDLIDA